MVVPPEEYVAAFKQEAPFNTPAFEKALQLLVQLHDVAASRGGVVTVVGETQTVRKVLRVSGGNALLGVPDSGDEPSADVDLSLLHADPSAT